MRTQQKLCSFPKLTYTTCLRLSFQNYFFLIFKDVLMAKKITNGRVWATPLFQGTPHMKRKRSLPVLLELPVGVSVLLQCPRTHCYAFVLHTQQLPSTAPNSKELEQGKRKAFARIKWLFFSPVIKIPLSGCSAEIALLHLAERLTLFIPFLSSCNRPLQKQIFGVLFCIFN